MTEVEQKDGFKKIAMNTIYRNQVGKEVLVGTVMELFGINYACNKMDQESDSVINLNCFFNSSCLII